MADETRSSGTVRWFDDNKCFGFIKPDDGGEDLFVHQSAIKSEGFRTLHEGQAVEFLIIAENNRTKAVDVTGPNGSPLEKVQNDGHDHRFGDHGFRSGGGGGGGGCYNCGESGHLARDCRSQMTSRDRSGGYGFRSGGGGGGGFGLRSSGGGGGGCYNCGESGHLARDCRSQVTSRDVGGGGGGGGCYNCGESGHLARDCRSQVTSRDVGGGGGGCFNCGEYGHVARECGRSRGGGSSGGGGGACAGVASGTRGVGTAVQRSDAGRQGIRGF
ncbi:hypothetical protein RHSIM_Rhsim08G0033300 [Rhododendron simsii]|uniref:Uncharacterized protein n=1 Tax=Rhododendron simsii TaxID=118357 RepID=A0A834GHJ3_RHOSS|nr:hypothetical protein RHSIM_Rhsim08G0033300 [Rhododendron simsii]